MLTPIGLKEKQDKIDDAIGQTNRLKLVWMWVKQEQIDFKDFEKLMEYINHFYSYSE